MTRQGAGSIRIMRLDQVSLGACALMFAVGGLFAAAPKVFKDPFRQSPVRAEPNDLLLIGGDGFGVTDKVVYKIVTNTASPPAHPATPPATNTASTGKCTVILDSGGSPLGIPS